MNESKNPHTDKLPMVTRMEFGPLSNPQDFIRMYVLVRTDIPYEHQAVQAGHAALKYVMEEPITIPFNRDVHDRNVPKFKSILSPYLQCIYNDKYVGHNFTWHNGTLIYLAVNNETELLKWETKLTKWGVRHSMFKEPDWSDREIPTALACMGFRGDFASLPLLKMPKGFFAKHCKSEKLNVK